MLLILRRDVFLPETTLGLLYVAYDHGVAYDGRRWVAAGPEPRPFGYTCEDQDRGLDAAMPIEEIRRIKVREETAIPTGEYATRVRWRASHKTDVIELLDVPGFAGILIHPGNRERDTAGCLLPGLTRSVEAGEVRKSTVATAWLLARSRECADRGEPVRVRVERDAAAWAARG